MICAPMSAKVAVTHFWEDIVIFKKYDTQRVYIYNSVIIRTEKYILCSIKYYIIEYPIYIFTNLSQVYYNHIYSKIYTEF